LQERRALSATGERMGKISLLPVGSYKFRTCPAPTATPSTELTPSESPKYAVSHEKGLLLLVAR